MPPASPSSSAGALIATLGLAGFASALASRITDPFVAELAREFAVAPETTALLGAAYTLPYAFMPPLLGPVGDALGKLRVMRVTVLALGVALLAGAAVGGLGPLFLLRALSGAAAGSVIPLSLALLGDRVPLERRQVAISRFLACLITGQLAGGVVASLVGDVLGWRGVMAGCAACALAAAAVLTLATRGAAAEPRHRLDPALALRRYGTILRTPAALVLYAAVFVEGVIVFGLFPYIAPLLEARGLGGTREAGLVIGAFGLGGFLYAGTVSALLRHLGQARMVRLGGAVAAAGLLGFALAPAWWAFPAAGLLLGTGFYMIHNSIQTRVTEVAPAARASATALHGCCFFLGQSLGVVAFGLVGTVPGLVFGAAAAMVLGLVLGRRPA